MRNLKELPWKEIGWDEVPVGDPKVTVWVCPSNKWSPENRVLVLYRDGDIRMQATQRVDTTNQKELRKVIDNLTEELYILSTLNEQEEVQ